MRSTPAQGFSAVELLIAIVVGVIFIGGIFQMYSVVINDAAVARNKSNASSVAYTQARTVLASITNPCVSSSSSTTPSSSLPTPVTMTTVIDCPFATSHGNDTISRIVVTVSYGKSSPQEKVQHVLYKF